MSFNNVRDKSKPARNGQGWALKYPFNTLAVGDSFEHACAGPTSREGNAVRQAAYQYAKRHGWKFTISRTANGLQIKRIT